jgi:hypothetical protein
MAAIKPIVPQTPDGKNLYHIKIIVLIYYKPLN